MLSSSITKHPIQKIALSRSALLKSLLLFLFLAALAVRVHVSKTFQVGDRQFRSAIMARAYYFKAVDSIPEWRSQVAETSQLRAGVLEPPIMEILVSWLYRLLRDENLWIPGLLSSGFWLIGGIFLYKIEERLVSAEAALFTSAYYLFVPMGVYISTGFVPDPLMLILFLSGIFAIIRYYDQPSRSRLVIAAAVSGLAILAKPFCLFAILGAFISLAIYRSANWRSVIDLPFLAFHGIVLLPALVYYSYGILAGGFLSRQAQTSFLPYLLLTPSFWRDWLLTAGSVVGFAPLIAALVGLPLLQKGLPRALLIGLSIGYIVFGLVFTYHIRFGPHYHTQLIIIVALIIGPLMALITNHLRQRSFRWYSWLPIAGAVLLVALFSIRELRSLGGSPSMQNARVAREIGEIVDHSTRVVYLAPGYGMPLEYYGELSGAYWPRRISDRNQVLGITTGVQSVKERLEALDFDPEYFVITQFREFDQHHTDLKQFLASNCSLIARSEQYLIYEVIDCARQ